MLMRTTVRAVRQDGGAGEPSGCGSGPGVGKKIRNSSNLHNV
jgi:hypothetical protein